MKDFIVFDPATEKILRTGNCPDEMVYLQSGINECVIEGKANDFLHKIDKSTVEVKDKTPEEIEADTPKRDEKEILIAQRKEDILRRMAIEELQKEGKIKEE